MSEQEALEFLKDLTEYTFSKEQMAEVEETRKDLESATLAELYSETLRYAQKTWPGEALELDDDAIPWGWYVPESVLKSWAVTAMQLGMKETEIRAKIREGMRSLWPETEALILPTGSAVAKLDGVFVLLTPEQAKGFYWAGTIEALDIFRVIRGG